MDTLRIAVLMAELTEGLLAYLLRHHMCAAAQLAAVAPLKVMRSSDAHITNQLLRPMKSTIKCARLVGPTLILRPTCKFEVWNVVND